MRVVSSGEVVDREKRKPWELRPSVFRHDEATPRKQRKAKDNRGESARWQRATGATEALLDEDVRAIHVMDREADSYAILSSPEEAGHSYVIRSFQTECSPITRRGCAQRRRWPNAHSNARCRWPVDRSRRRREDAPEAPEATLRTGCFRRCLRGAVEAALAAALEGAMHAGRISRSIARRSAARTRTGPIVLCVLQPSATWA